MQHINIPKISPLFFMEKYHTSPGTRPPKFAHRPMPCEQKVVAVPVDEARYVVKLGAEARAALAEKFAARRSGRGPR